MAAGIVFRSAQVSEGQQFHASFALQLPAPNISTRNRELAAFSGMRIATPGLNVILPFSDTPTTLPVVPNDTSGVPESRNEDNFGRGHERNVDYDVGFLCLGGETR